MEDAAPPSFEAAKAHVKRLARLGERERTADHFGAADRGGLDADSSRAVARALGVRLVGVRKRQRPLDEI